ncbi:hypothetical protein B0T18DRAFT_228965 [Schizothecium vesticola]|uniref:Uncharacterized protein n=1 Tax=Schizothecium vesticola TaxID=314040 RepID=A0AA40EL53_9PEZI|nr:hypothetical protein B0T18DRAFT_228965 [Schizothecium vesticola]
MRLPDDGSSESSNSRYSVSSLGLLWHQQCNGHQVTTPSEQLALSTLHNCGLTRAISSLLSVEVGSHRSRQWAQRHRPRHRRANRASKRLGKGSKPVSAVTSPGMASNQAAAAVLGSTRARAGWCLDPSIVARQGQDDGRLARNMPALRFAETPPNRILTMVILAPCCPTPGAANGCGGSRCCTLAGCADLHRKSSLGVVTGRDSAF